MAKSAGGMEDAAHKNELHREVPMSTHTWRWRKYLPDRYGQACRILVTGAMNSALVEFGDGARYVTSRYAVRRAS